MKTTAFASIQRAANDQLRHLGEVAQFQQARGDAEAAVVVVNFAPQQFDAVQRAFQALGGADDADIVPHEASQLLPVVRDDHFLVRIRNAGFVPAR